MMPYLVSYYGNPHSRTHAYGWETEEAVEKARKVRHFIINNCTVIIQLSNILTHVKVNLVINFISDLWQQQKSPLCIYFITLCIV